MKIEVLQNYGGLDTGWARISEGMYDENAPELFGVGRSLVERGIARYVVEVQQNPKQSNLPEDNDTAIPSPAPRGRPKRVTNHE
jgi:hypothetical protein